MMAQGCRAGTPGFAQADEMTDLPTLPRRGYSRLQIGLHWAIALLLVVSFLSHEGMKDAWSAWTRQGTAVGSGTLHVAVGLAVLALALLRLAVRLWRGAPPRVPGSAALELAARVVHAMLYALLILIPASGAAAWFLGIDSAAEVHEVLFNLGWMLVALHSAAALFHHYVLRDGLIGRMLRPA
jgi:cytochrome b561